MGEITKVDEKTIMLEREIPVDKVNKAFNGIYSELRKRISIPGFRRGKVPNNVIRMRIGSDYIESEVKEMLVSEDYPKALAENEITPVKEEFQEAEVKEGTSLKYKVKIDTDIEFDLPEYTGKTFDVLKADVTDEEFEKEIEKRMERFNKIEEITEDRGIKVGDTAFIKFEGKINGEVFEGGTSENYPLEIGSKSFIEGFEEGLIGMKKGETKVIDLTFPENYHADFAGKDVAFEVTINKIKEKIKSDYTEDVLKKLGVESKDEFYKKTREELEKTKKDNQKKTKENLIIENIVKDLKIDLPELLVNRKVAESIDKFEQNLKYQNMNLKIYLSRINMTEEKFAELMRPQAENDVKVEIVLKKIFEKENFELNEDELLEEISKVKPDVKTIEEMNKLFLDNPFLKTGMKQVLRFKKTIDFLLENNTFNEVDELPQNEEEKEAE